MLQAVAYTSCRILVDIIYQQYTYGNQKPIIKAYWTTNNLSCYIVDRAPHIPCVYINICV